MRVRNKSGTSLCNARLFSSWKKFYIGNKKRKWPDICRIKGCCESARSGAHVEIEGDCPCVYIVPMCDKHNTPHIKDWLQVKGKTILVKIESEDSKGPAGVCYEKKCH